ncbi:MAG: RHS repeat-associated core domain-containing protein [Cytophagales bacterium]|nr:MAG: RHS repeat-associated core domain-containing protein [Cytophagales bacterium]
MPNHKNRNDAKGNFSIYKIFLNTILFKFGKADSDRITASSGLPTRLHQQIRKLVAQGFSVAFEIITYLFSATTKEAKNVEDEYVENYKKETGKYPAENKQHQKKKKK